MKHITIEELYPTPWGLVAGRRDEIERGGYGTFARVYAEEVERQFPTAKQVAVLMGCGESTARRWLAGDKDCRCVIRGNVAGFYREDVMRIAKERQARIHEKEEKRRRTNEQH